MSAPGSNSTKAISVVQPGSSERDALPHDQGMSTEDAVAHGIKATAGVVTSAAIVMVAVFAIFATLGEIVFQMMGVGLAAAILIDATIVRGVLLPSTMKLLGDWNWYLPRWLEWLPSITTPRAAEPASNTTPGERPHAILPRTRSHRATVRSVHRR